MTGLRRTSIARKTELKRGRVLARKKPMARVAMARRTVEKQRKQARDTGPTAATKALLWERAGGACERCSLPLSDGQPFSRHHRRPRGSGGSSVPCINEVTNLLLLCGTATTGCHGWVEVHPTESYREGWKVHLTSLSPPARIPVLMHIDRGILAVRYYLTPDGDYSLEPRA